MRPRTGAEVKAVLEAERAGSAFVMFGDDAGMFVVRPLDDDPPLVTVGRHDACQVSLSWDPKVSSTHAVLERLGQTWTISDDGISRNGTFVNDGRISSRRRLSDRDTIRIGATLLTFREPVVAGVTATLLDGQSAGAAITPMQRKVLLALCRPLKDAPFAPPASNAQIAAELVLSVDAVKTHLRGLSERFGVGQLPQNQKRAKLVERAFHTGVVSERDL